MIKAIVTGGCGFIGFNLCDQLIRRNYTVDVIDNLSSGYKENYIGGINYHYDDLQNIIEEKIKTVKPDVIFHLAAVPRVSFSVENPFLTAVNNVLATIKILEAVKKHHPECRVINSSSSSIYGDCSLVPTPEYLPSNPKSPYALQKYQSEQWCDMFHSLYGLDTVSLRYFNVIGPHSRYGGAYSTVLSAWLYSLWVDPSISPYLEGDGNQSRDFCYVDNVVEANILAAERKTSFKGETFNIAQGKTHTLLEVKEILEQISGKKLILERRSPRIGDVYLTWADISRAQNELGYNPSTDFFAHVKSMHDWYRDWYPKN